MRLWLKDILAAITTAIFIVSTWWAWEVLVWGL